MFRTAVCAALAALAFLAAAGVSCAQDYVPGPRWAGYGYGLAYHVYDGWETIPYFSLHPPVYYSYPVPRPYGWSPYAYPPGVLTPEVEELELPPPAMIRNPFVDPGDNAAPVEKEAKTASRGPLRLANPYVMGPADRARVADAAK